MSISREKFKTYKNVFDEFTLRTLFKLSSEGFFDELKSPIAVGKESNVFTAETSRTKKIIVKIYRLETCDFTKMYDYIKYDERFQGLMNNRRKVIFAWVQREYRNLMVAREAGVNVPLALSHKNNVILIEMIGNNAPALKLKDAIPKNPKKFIEDVIKEMKKLHKAGLVHGDLSEFNILNFEETPCLIDFSQGTTIDSPNYEELLKRDVRNICRFAKKINVICDEEKILKEIIS